MPGASATEWRSFRVFMQFRPTLVIGLGGSGTYIVRRLKKRLRRILQGELPPSIQLLAFDTDQQNADESLEDLPAQEFHRLSNFQGDNWVSAGAKSQNPAIAQFWQYSSLHPGFINDGARQRPPIGRLALFAKFDELSRQITGSVDRMFRITPTYTPAPNIHEVDTYV